MPPTRVPHFRSAAIAVKADKLRRAIPDTQTLDISRLTQAITADFTAATFTVAHARAHTGVAALQMTDGALSAIGADHAGFAFSGWATSHQAHQHQANHRAHVKRLHLNLFFPV